MHLLRARLIILLVTLLWCIVSAVLVSKKTNPNHVIAQPFSDTSSSLGESFEDDFNVDGVNHTHSLPI